MDVVSLCTGIGGFELGFAGSDLRTVLACEIHEGAQRVLGAHFPDIPVHGDLRSLRKLPPHDMVVAGFPCQDLSQAGRTQGIFGPKSGLVLEIFRLVRQYRPAWVLLENVPFMLRRNKGEAMTLITSRLESLGYQWAYRTIDARAFGLAQRRSRVFLLASRTACPASILLAPNISPPALDPKAMPAGVACGFSWTEGKTGLGWAVDAVPTIRGGSGLGIPSPPAIITAGREVGTPTIEDLEALQGFPRGWTAPAGARPRWLAVGNAVVPAVVQWIVSRLGVASAEVPGEPLGKRWGRAAFSRGGGRFSSQASPWPQYTASCLQTTLQNPVKPLSLRALTGFLKRARAGRLRFPPGFLELLDATALRR